MATVYDVKDISDAARIAQHPKSIFPLTNRAYRLALTAPVTLAKDERIFSKSEACGNIVQLQWSVKET